LAIAETLAERFPQHALWPRAETARAHARSVSAEMHSGFAELRQNMSMNIRASFPGKGATPGALADIARIEALWRDCLDTYGGPFLFGEFSIAGCDVRARGDALQYIPARAVRSRERVRTGGPRRHGRCPPCARVGSKPRCANAPHP